MKQKVIIFDLMGTLLDLSALDPLFRDAFGPSRARQEWFEETLKTAFAMTTAGEWAEFADITKASLKVLEQKRGRGLSWFQRRRILAALKELPPFADVPHGLQELREHGHTLGVLTNSSVKAAAQALQHAGLTRQFDKIFSAEKVKRLKPAREPYLMASKAMHIKPGKALFVAAHAWDIRGAKRAGLHTCFLARPGQVLDELAPQPEFVASDLGELAAALS